MCVPCVCAEARGGYKVSSTLPLSLLWRWSRLLNLKIWTSSLLQGLLPSELLTLQGWGQGAWLCSEFYHMGAGNSNPGRHGCTASLLLSWAVLPVTGPSPLLDEPLLLCDVSSDAWRHGSAKGHFSLGKCGGFVCLLFCFIFKSRTGGG